AEDGIRDKLVTGVQTCALPICSPAAFRQARHGLSELGCRRILLPDLELSRLARDRLLRESLLYLPYAHPRFRPGALPSAHGRTLPLGALGICFSHGAPASLCSVERGADLPMGRAPDSPARSDFVFGSRTQSDFRSAAADLRRSSSLLLQA